jgi:glucose-6-phosphate 1-epimerase
MTFMQTLQDLSARFSFPGRVLFEAGGGGLTCATLKSPGGESEVYLHGAHVTKFAPVGGRPLLFMSAQSLFQNDKPIRGGVPVIFPWFGPRQNDAVGNSPMHGFARLMDWTVETASHDEESTTLVLRLASSAATRTLWAGEFVLRYTVIVAKTLTLELSVDNTGGEAFTFEEALHTYLAVADVRQCAIEGLDGVTYLDKTDGMAKKVQSGAIQIIGETDRVYLGTKSTCTVSDPGNGRRIVVAKEDSDATVVWNPWIAKAKAMADFGDEEWTKMLCIETCNVNVHAITLAAGGRHSMRAAIGEDEGKG